MDILKNFFNILIFIFEELLDLKYIILVLLMILDIVFNVKNRFIKYFYL